MTRPPRIYTRGGDDGTTGLVGGARVRKDDLRIECVGVLDECSSAIGLARRKLAEHARLPAAAEVAAWLAWTQDALFNLGSAIATPAGAEGAAMPRIRDEDVRVLEAAIDRAQDAVEPLTAFIHPGGAPAGGLLHFARAKATQAPAMSHRLGAIPSTSHNQASATAMYTPP